MSYTESQFQIVEMNNIDENDKVAHRLIGMTSTEGIFVFVETFNIKTWEWEQDDTFTQWQLWEEDRPDHKKPIDISKDKDCLDFFAGQGLVFWQKVE
jgi:hypothetical protein